MFAAVTVAEENGVEDPRDFALVLDALRIDPLSTLENFYIEKTAADIWQRRRLYAWDRQLVIKAQHSAEVEFARRLDHEREGNPPEYLRLRQEGIRLRKSGMALDDAVDVLTEAAEAGSAIRAALERAIGLLREASVAPSDCPPEPASLEVAVSAWSCRIWNRRLSDLLKRFPIVGLKDEQLLDEVKVARKGLKRASRSELRTAEERLERAAELESTRGPDVLEDGTDLASFRERHSMPAPELMEQMARYATSIDRRIEKDVAGLLAIRRELQVNAIESGDEITFDDVAAATPEPRSLHQV